MSTEPNAAVAGDAGPPPWAAGASRATAATCPALRALCAVARLHHIAADPGHLAHHLGLAPGVHAAPDDLLLAARHIGLKAQWVHSRADRLPLVPLPALALLHGTQPDTLRVVVLAQCDGERVLLQDPGASEAGQMQIEAVEVFCRTWSGQLLLLASHATLAGEPARFDFSWFVPSLVKYRALLGEVLLISFMLQLFALVSPLFFQVVMDKVLVHRGLATLDVLVLGLLLVVVFESLLTGLRAYVLSHTTSRIDVELGSRLFRHLLQLPLSYFQVRRVGDSVARVRELENIRQFLTGSTLTVLLDVVFSVVFVGVMCLYSVQLTLVVLASVPIYLVLSMAVSPVLRKRLDTKFARGAENQALLVETITGIQTVKASALEPAFGRRWERQLAAYVSASFKTQNLAAWAHEAVNLTGKLVNAVTLWFGAHLVMDNQLTVGQFVAFNMFAQRVAQPIMRMAQLWTDFQQTGISMARLGDILDTRSEVPAASGAQMPTIRGRITLDAVGFRYHPAGKPVLQDVQLDIRPGEVVGIVGRSGSGKSTLTKLMQRLYTPDQGRVLVDGIDISLMDASQLRRQIGVVLQENLLFNRSVRENIAISDPAAPIELVARAAQLAGAHDFVSDLPQAYDTVVGEQGCAISGGQRQRIAIARALFTNPRILILDEATSALDYESEAALQRNMQHICRGRTVLVIAHRLSSVRHADRIVVLDGGRIVELGNHVALLQIPNGIYARLWQLQDGTGPAPEATV